MARAAGFFFAKQGFLMWLGVNHILADTKTAVFDEKVEIRGFKMFLKRKYLQNWFKFVKIVAFPRKLATIVGCNFEQSILFLIVSQAEIS